ncbi:hypothetical protein M569_02439 [Genlisea aurea]|uniref:B box-type domain-containing protein n=1 Tax=Genlisea aurea TaxID=192259 RepID=S8E915_9LAMI|nr:hypothetical protein M569_02439 [Genlisea aurea]
MKIQCDVCEKAPATVICCADEAALCSRCDTEVHAANKLASKHQRLQLHTLSGKLPPCDICQDKTAFIFCVEDRALFCKDCDQSIHSANKRAASHQRFLATGIRVSLTASCCKQDNNNQTIADKEAAKQPPSSLSPWDVEDLLRFSDYGSSDKVVVGGLGELEWLSDMDLFNAAEVPQLLPPPPPPPPPPARQVKYCYNNTPATSSTTTPHKKPRLEIPDDDDEFLIVPDLG